MTVKYLRSNIISKSLLMFSSLWSKRQQLAAALLASAFIICGSFTIYAPHQKSGEAEAEQDEPLEALRQEFLKTRDPKLNIVPRERLTVALSYYEQQQKLMSRMKTTGFTTVTWSERGPNNIGGRTRSLLFDLNDATHNTVFAGSVGGGLWKCTNITAVTPTWTPVNDQFGNLAVTTIAQNATTPQTMYFGTGEGWSNSDAIRGNGIWKTTNGGTTWTQLSATNNNNDFAYVQKIIVSSLGHVYAACRGTNTSTGGLFKSTDGGSNWTRVIGNTGTSTDLRIADIEEAANGDLYATAGIFTTGRIFKSTQTTYTTNVGNSGNWTDITPTGTWQRIELAVAPSSSSTVYAVCQGSSNEVTGIYSSTTGGTSWTPRTIPTIYDQGSNSVFTRNQSWYDLMCTVDPNTSTTLYIGGVDILKSTNSGANWSQLTSWSLYDDGSFWPAAFPWGNTQNVHADIHTLVFKPGSSTTAAVGCDGGLFYAANLNAAAGLPSWTSKSINYNVTQYYACATHPTNANYFLAGAQDNGSHKFSTSGINTVAEVTGGDGAFCFIDKTNGNNQITSYVRNNFYYSTDGGNSFYDVDGYDNTGRFINPADLDGTNDILYSAAGTNTLARWASVFSGSANRTDLTVSIGGDQISAIKVSPNTPTTVYVGTDNGRVYRITNANATPTVTNLTSSQLVSGGYVSSIDIVKRSTNTDDSILVAMSNYGINSVYYTANGTNASPTWVDIDDNNTLQDIPVRWAIWSPANSKILFLGTEVGVIGTGTLNGNSTIWTSTNNGTLPNVRVDMLQVNSSSEVVVATHGRGLWTSNNITPLELKLLSFNARLINQKVELGWEVNDDKEARQYIIERMYPGGDFMPIGKVIPSGKNLYTWTDAFIEAGRETIYYRLKTEDVKTEIRYSPVRTINIVTSANFIEQVFPTVSSGVITVKAGNAAVKQMRVQLTDAYGRIVMNQVLPYGSTALSVRQHTPGTYILNIFAVDGTEKYSTRVLVK
jgi:hypothetical protein